MRRTTVRVSLTLVPLIAVLVVYYGAFAEVSPRFPLESPGWRHTPGSPGHFPSKGLFGTDDTYVLDLNWDDKDGENDGSDSCGDPPTDAQNDAWDDCGKPVFAAASGEIQQVRSDWGWVLIKHQGQLQWNGRSYSSWFTGYLHMVNIPESLSEGMRVSRGRKIGEVGNTTGLEPIPPHLHFGIYVGRVEEPPDANAYLQSVDPGVVGDSAFKGFQYGDAIYDEWVDDSTNHDERHSFSKSGSTDDWTESDDYGFYPTDGGADGHMLYTRTREDSADNVGEWRHSVGEDGNYGIFVFVPRNYATTTNARYKVLVNGECVKNEQDECKEWVINQSEYFGTWVPLGLPGGFDFEGVDQGGGSVLFEGGFSFQAGDEVTIRLSDKTREPPGTEGCNPINDTSGDCTYVAYDAIRFFRKQDARMRQELPTGTSVKTNARLRVRETACTDNDQCPVKEPIRTAGTAGVVLEGPQRADQLDWYKIHYDDGVTGWSALTGQLETFSRPSPKFNTGDTIEANRELPAYQNPCIGGDNCTPVSDSPVSPGTTGSILSFDDPRPRVVDGSRWWKVRYDDGTEGWSVEDGLQLVTSRPEVEHLTLQEAVSRGLVKLRSKGEFFGDGVTFIGTGQNDEDVIVQVRVGDGILTKDPSRQDLIVTQNGDIFLPASEEVRKEGIWIACLDSGKSAPQEGAELDITANLSEWPQQLAHELLDKLQEQEGNITQDAVWQISDRENFPELSNPVRSSPGSSFTTSPELSLVSIIAKHAEKCPKAKSNPDTIICRREIEFATWLYYSEQSVPGTTQRKIDLQTLREMVSFYVTQTPTNHPPAGASSQQVDAQLQQLLKRARPTPLSLNDVTVVPNPIRTVQSARFLVRGMGIENLNIDIYNLSGVNIFSSSPVAGNTFTWHLRTDYGNVVANGVYLYRVTVRGTEGQVMRSGVKKLVVMR